MRDEEELSPYWVNNNWFRNHLAILPVGTLIATWLLLGLGAGEWHWWSCLRDLTIAGQVAPFGVAVYGTLAFIAEMARRGWTILRREKAIEQARMEGDEEGFQRGLEEGRRHGRSMQ